jgi:hypothetical protein
LQQLKILKQEEEEEEEEKDEVERDLYFRKNDEITEAKNRQVGALYRAFFCL